MADRPAAGDHPGEALAALGEPWRLAFEQAWTSWCAGSFGIGAALVDPRTGGIVAVGRNRVAQRQPEPGLLSGNFVAHAEMNAFAAMKPMMATGLHLYTTLQPCLMCAAAAVQLNVEHVHFAARDEFFESLDDLWGHHPYTRDRQPSSDGPIGGRLAHFARVLPLSFTLLWAPDSRPAVHARRRQPALATVAEAIVGDAEIVAVRDRGGSVAEVLDVVWDRLAL